MQMPFGARDDRRIAEAVGVAGGSGTLSRERNGAKPQDEQGLGAVSQQLFLCHVSWFGFVVRQAAL